MGLSIADVEARVPEYVEAYRETAPFYPVEKEAIESLPAAFRAGEYGNRDVEWVVRWYFRRGVTDIDHEERRAVEAAIADTEPRELRGAMRDAIDALDEKRSDRPHNCAIDAITRIPRVDVAVASALLWFLVPDECFVVGEREWAVVASLTDGTHLQPDLNDQYPDPMTVSAYDRYLDAVCGLADRLAVDHWHLYMTIRSVHAAAIEDGELSG